MRLIDADELLEYFFRAYSNEEVYTNLDIKQIIDNAPTVEPTFGLFKDMLCSECEKKCNECVYKADFKERLENGEQI